MDKLVDQCLKYFCERINSIVKLPLDLSCISDEIIDKLCKELKDNQLNHFVDKKGIFIDRVYSTKINQLLDSHTFYKCSLCNKIYTSDLKDLRCSNAQNQIDYYGNSLIFHLPLAEFNGKIYYNTLLSHNYSKEKIYWILWSVSQYLRCTYCHQYFPIIDYEKCKYHPRSPILSTTDNSLRYPCCGSIYIKQETIPNGCAYRNHTLESNNISTEILNCYKKRKNDVIVNNAPVEEEENIEIEEDEEYRPTKSKSERDYLMEFRTFYQKPIPTYFMDDKEKLEHYQKTVQLEDDIRRMDLLNRYLHRLRRSKQYANTDI